MRLSLRLSLLSLGAVSLPLVGLAAAPMARLELSGRIAMDLHGSTHDADCVQRFFRTSTPVTKLFTDVTVDEDFADTLCIGMRAGYLRGQGDGSFLPHKTANMAETATMVGRAYGLFTPSTNSNDPWYAAAMRDLNSKQIIDGSQAPGAPVNTDQAAEILRRAQAYAREHGTVTLVTRPESDTETPTDLPADTDTELEFGSDGRPMQKLSYCLYPARDSHAKRDLPARRDAYVTRRTMRANVEAARIAREMERATSTTTVQ